MSNLCVTSAELRGVTIFTFALLSTLWPTSKSLVNPKSIDMHPFARICERMCVCIHTPLLPRHRLARKHTSHVFPKWSFCFLTAPRRRESQKRGKWVRRGVSQANTKGYCTHSPLNIKDSGNCSTLLSGSSGTVGHLIHLTLGMRENGFSGDEEPFGTLYCG